MVRVDQTGCTCAEMIMSCACRHCIASFCCWRWTVWRQLLGLLREVSGPDALFSLSCSLPEACAALGLPCALPQAPARAAGAGTPASVASANMILVRQPH